MVDYGLSRVSSDDQKQLGSSAELQVDELLKPIERYPDKNLTKENVIKAEAVSGGFKNGEIIRYWENDFTEFHIIFKCKGRDDLRTILRKVKNKDRIFFSKWDRLSRHAPFLQEFYEWCKEKEIKLCPLNDDTTDIVRQILSVLGQFERQQTIERNDRFIKGYYERGLWGYKAPFGYDKNCKDRNTKQLKYPKLPDGLLIQHKKEAGIVREIFQLTAEGNNYKTICELLKINPQTYYNILSNKAYIGMTHYRDEWKKGNHEPIITQELFDKANSLIKTKQIQ